VVGERGKNGPLRLTFGVREGEEWWWWWLERKEHPHQLVFGAREGQGSGGG
jgi:hypothetical protein